MLAEVGEGGFGAQDLELIQQLGALSWCGLTALHCTVKNDSKGSTASQVYSLSHCRCLVSGSALHGPMHVPVLHPQHSIAWEISDKLSVNAGHRGG